MKYITLLLLVGGLKISAIAQDTTVQKPIQFYSSYVQFGFWNESFFSTSKSSFAPPQSKKVSYGGFQFLAGKSFFLSKDPSVRPYIHVDWIRTGLVLFGGNPALFAAPMHPGFGVYLRQNASFSLAAHLTAGYNMSLLSGRVFHSILYTPSVKVNFGQFALFAEYRRGAVRNGVFDEKVQSYGLGLGFHF